MSVDFSQLNKKFAKNFNSQKARLKKLLSGKAVNCELCNSALTIELKNQNQEFLVKCSNGCTTLTLEID